MGTKLTQGTVNRIAEEHEAGQQVYDADVSGLRIVVGSKSSSYKLVGRINDGSDRYVSIVIGRTDEVSLKTAREKAAELKLALRRGEDPRAPKRTVPSLRKAWERYKETRGVELQPSTVAWYEEKVLGVLKPILDIPLDKLDRETVRALHEKVTKKNGPYGANGAMRALKAVYNDAARTQDLPPNPVSRAVRMNKEAPRKWALDAAGLKEAWRCLEAMEDQVRAACWTVMLLTGLRSHDARSMRWEHLDADGVLMLHDLLATDIGGWHPSRGIPRTQALAEQKAHSLDPASKWWMAVLDRGSLPVSEPNGWHREPVTLQPVDKAELVEDYDRYLKSNRVFSSKASHRAIVSAGRALGLETGRTRGNTERSWTLPPLAEARRLDADRLNVLVAPKRAVRRRREAGGRALPAVVR